MLDAWTRAILEQDVAAVDEIVHPSFVLRSSGGVASELPRDRWIAALAQIVSDSLDVLEYEERHFGDVGVTRSLQRWSAHMGDRDLTGDYLIVDVYRRDAGTWRPAWRVSQRLS